MQFAKDSFYIALRNRLASINPQRVMELGGVTRPAILVTENHSLNLSESSNLRNVFELRWGVAGVVAAGRSRGRPLMNVEVQISYVAEGLDATGTDRGRMLTTLDSELLQMCTPRSTPKQDYSQVSPMPLGTYVFWSDPQFEAASEAAGLMRRTARLSVFYFPEVEVA